MIRVARTMKRYLSWILNYLVHRHTNPRAEAVNSKMDQVKYQARGYGNRDNFRRAILFHCGGLDLYPR